MMASRLPIGVNGLAVLIYVSDETGSFATAGIVSGLIALGMAGGGPIQSRFVDDSGIRVLVVAACAYGVAMVALFLFAAGDGLIVPLFASALVAGAAVPTASSVLRSRWPELVGGDKSAVTAAYALDSVLIQILVVVGPLVTALAIATTGVEGALALSVIACVAGTLAFTVLLPVEGLRPGERTSILQLGALASPGLRTLVYSSVPLGFFIGGLETALPAYAEEIGDPELGGVLMALFAGPSIVAGLLYGLRAKHVSLTRTHLALSALLPLGCVPLAFADSSGAVIVLAALAGLPVSPVIAGRNELVGPVAVPGRAAESFAWPLTALIVGISLGAGAAGVLAQAHGWSTAVAASIAAAALGAALLVLMRGSLEGGDLERNDRQDAA